MNQHFNLDSVMDYLALEKRRVTIPGAEPYFMAGQSDTAFLVLHGWSASAESVRFLASGLANAGHTVLAPTLPGHGASSEQMLAVGPVDWNEAARGAATTLRRHFDKVVVMGISMGGALAIQLAASSPELVNGIVTINAPVFMANAAFAQEILSAPNNGFLVGWNTPDFVGEPVHEISYAKRFKKSGADLYAMCSLAREMLPLIKAPMLVAQSVLDPVVPKSCADEILANAGAETKSALWLERSYHASQLDLDRDRIVSATLDFFGWGTT
jgi:carboxylesterase